MANVNQHFYTGIHSVASTGFCEMVRWKLVSLAQKCSCSPSFVFIGISGQK
jgi:hypothetical protein